MGFGIWDLHQLPDRPQVEIEILGFQPKALRDVVHRLLEPHEGEADRFDLRKDIEFQTSVEKAIWDDAECRWAISTSKGETLSAQHYMMASGCLSHSKLPEIPGVESFEVHDEKHWTAKVKVPLVA